MDSATAGPLLGRIVDCLRQASTGSQWTREPVLIRAAAGNTLIGDYDWDRLESVLLDQVLRIPTVTVVKNGHPLASSSFTLPAVSAGAAPQTTVDGPATLELLRGGASLILRDVHRLDPVVGLATRRAAAVLETPLYVNLFATPNDSVALTTHRDDYHAMLLQTAGSKTWRLWRPESDPSSTAASHHIDLEPGDALWIPRGWWHAGQSQLASIHLNFSAVPATLDELLDTLTAPAPYQSLVLPPLAVSAPTTVRQALQASITQLQAALDACSDTELAELVMTVQRHRFTGQPATSGRDTDRSDLDNAHVHPELIIASLPRAGARLLFTVAGEIEVPEATADQVLSGSPTAALRALDDDVAANLIRAGILCFNSGRPGCRLSIAGGQVEATAAASADRGGIHPRQAS